MLKKSSILIILTVLIFNIISCITSVRPDKDELFPPEANWHFVYFDSFGVTLREGKSVVTFNKEEETFSLKLIEGVFGKNAEISGEIGDYNKDYNAYPFKGSGTWFEDGNYIIEGFFNSNFDTIFDGAIAYDINIEEDIQDIIQQLREYRSNLMTYEILPEEEKNKTVKPEKPVSDEYIQGLFTWKATLIYEDIESEEE
jgi:hypothetical protein